MKRNEKKVPGFDEIIFQNRNKTYGAYDLRKHYKSTVSFSVLGVTAFFAILIWLLSALMQKDAIAITGGQIWLTTTPALYDPNKYDPPEKPLPVNLQNRPAYIPPEIVDADTLPKDAGFMTNDLAIQVVVDGKVPVNIDSVMKDIAPEPVKSDEPVVSSQEPPEFPGGPAALIQFIGENTKYPAEAIDINLQGKVIIKFAVWSDGSVRRIEVLRGVSPILDQEAIRVVSTLPKWKPGKQNGVPVSVWFSVPVTFRITSQ